MKRCSECKEDKPETDFYVIKSGRQKGQRYTHCKACRNARTTASRKAKPEHYRLQQLNRRRRIRAEIIQAYGGLCACCGETRPEFLAVDHVNGGGNAHRRQVGEGQQFYGWLRRNGYPKEGFRLLCHNCNYSYGLYGYCPHKGVSASSS